jgi:hypothetical protein
LYVNKSWEVEKAWTYGLSVGREEVFVWREVDDRETEAGLAQRCQNGRINHAPSPASEHGVKNVSRKLSSERFQVTYWFRNCEQV